MSYEVHEKEFENVIRLPSFDRYQYFLNKVADWEEIWSVGHAEGWRMMSDAEGTVCIPVWPARAYAEACCQGPWSGDEPRAISLDDWLTRWLPGMRDDGRKVAVFPLPSDQGLVFEVDRLREDLEETLEQYE